MVAQLATPSLSYGQSTRVEKLFGCQHTDEKVSLNQGPFKVTWSRMVGQSLQNRGEHRLVQFHARKMAKSIRRGNRSAERKQIDGEIQNVGKLDAQADAEQESENHGQGAPCGNVSLEVIVQIQQVVMDCPVITLNRARAHVWK